MINWQLLKIKYMIPYITINRNYYIEKCKYSFRQNSMVEQIEYKKFRYKIIKHKYEMSQKY